MKHTFKWCMLFTVVMAFTSCVILDTASDYDKKIDFKKLKSYNYYENGVERLALNNLDKPRMLNAVDATMTKMGFDKTNKPDFLVNVVVFSTLKTKSDWGYSGGGYQWDAATLAYQWRESQFGPLDKGKQVADGRIIIDFLNPRTKAIMWHGVGTGFNFDNYDSRELRINSAVKQILMQYPPVY